MKAHTNDFKNAIKLHGKQLDSKITYSSDGETIELGVEQLNSITPHYEGGILKSVMRGLTIDSNVEIPKGTVLNYQFGVLVGNSYEYIDFGNYVVNTIEKKEDTNSYSIECCDKMLYSMVDYDSTNITYPITVRNYINAICTKLGLTFKNVNDTFVNYDKEIPNELYSNIGYTFRDVLDELAQVTASTICINENDDELEIRYIDNELGQDTEYLLRDLEDEQDISGMMFTMDTTGYTAEQLTENIGTIEMAILGDDIDWYWLFISDGEEISRIFPEATIYKIDGTIFDNFDSSHMYLWCALSEFKNGYPNFKDVYILNDLTLNVKYGDLYFGENSSYAQENIISYPDSVVWNCMKVINIPLQQRIINEEYLKDVDVSFGEKYGPINSIVLTRAGGADSVYLQDQQSITQNGLCELKIEDNQIMNGNDRADYLTGILAKLKGLEYYTNDFTSTGITYLELCDRYNVVIGENTYPCIMFNDEIDITQGLQEIIHTDMPEQSETDYKYASKDDRQINQAYVIAKKNEAEIIALANRIVDVSKTIQGIGQIQLENAHEGILHRLEISGNISSLFPSDELYPSDTLYPKACNLLVDETLYNLDFDYLNYISSTVFDKYVYEDGKQWIERNVGVDNQGNKYALQETVIEQGEDIEILVKKDSTISMPSFNNAILKCTYLLENEYTSTFANQVEVKSELNLLGDTLEAKVSQVADEDGNVTSASIILAVNNDTSQAKISGDKISLEGQEIDLTSNNIKINSENFSVDETGAVSCSDISIVGGNIDISVPIMNEPAIILDESNLQCTSKFSGSEIRMINNAIPGTFKYTLITGMEIALFDNISIPAQKTFITMDEVKSPTITQTSLEESKKNIKLFTQNALDIINNIDIYSYNLKTDKNNSKKHIGFVIGDKYNYRKEITNANNNGADLYSFVSVCCKAIQEQQEQIELLKQEIKSLKERIDK